MKFAVEYLRYSSASQNEQSIEGQDTVCRKYAEENGYTIIGQYIDRAMTGKNDHRPDLQRLIADSARSEWKFVLVYKGDRFARNRIEAAINKKRLKDNGVKLISCTENIPDSPEGIILESLLDGMAEYYSEELSQKVKRGINESLKKNYHIGGKVLFGYKADGHKIIIDESKADIVRLIFQMYADGQIVRNISTYLYDKGLTERKLPTNTIYNYLKNKKYIGITEINGEQYSIYPRIIEQELWEKVQKIVEENKYAPSRKKAEVKFLLSGKLFCGKCGAYMIGESGTGKSGRVYNYYKCAEKKKNRSCDMKQIPKDSLEELVISSCWEVLNSGFVPFIVDKIYNVRQEKLKNNAVIDNLNQRLISKQKQFDNYIAAIGQGLFEGITNDLLKSVQTEISTIKTEIEKEKARQNAYITKEDIASFLTEFVEVERTPEFDFALVDMLIKKIVVFDDYIKIYFNFSPKTDDVETESVQFDFPFLREKGIIRTLFISPLVWGIMVQIGGG